jgi:hypothetical protein
MITHLESGSNTTYQILPPVICWSLLFKVR